ncbi:MAG: hypothetical protein GY953_57330, partial [bacterium]|nr:hypothetical protein [bacterium]
MMRGFVFLLLVAMTPSPGMPVERGLYYRHAERDMGLWVPRGLARYKEPLKSAYAGWINRSRQGLRGFSVREVSASDEESSDPVEDYISFWKNGSSRQFKTVEFEVIRDVPAAGRRATLIWHKNLTGDENFDKDEEFIHAGIPLENGNTLDLSCHFLLTSKERALEEIYWILGTLRFSGEAGLDPWLGRRIMHRGTGLSFRPPLAFRVQATDVAIHLARTKTMELSIGGPASGVVLGPSSTALKPVGKPWDSPHMTLPLRAGCYSAANRSEAALTAKVPGGQTFIIR